MNINTGIRNKYHQGFKRKNSDINEIIVHGTGGGESVEALIKWMMGGEREKEYSRGVALFHYAIGYDGDVTEIIDINNWVYHSSSGKHDRHTIGIELMNRKWDNSGEYTKEQYESLTKLIIQLINIFPNINSISGHGATKLKYSNKYKQCPGKNFNWKLLDANVGKNGYLHTLGSERIINIVPGPEVGVEFK